MVLRIRAPELLPFLAPSIPQNWVRHWHASRPALRRPTQTLLSKSRFSTAACRNAAASSAAAARRPDSMEDNTDSEANNAFDPSQSSTPASTDQKANYRAQMDRILDGAFPQGNARKAPVRERYEYERKRPGEFFSKMNQAPSADPTSFSQDKSQEELMTMLNESKRAAKVTPRQKRTVRSRPEVGRTVEINPARGVDFGRALGMLGSLCARNNVRRDQIMQKYYERRGQKRKRLKKERWRRLFMTGFRATVQRVRMMRRQGW